jgi:hypothetical protein
MVQCTAHLRHVQAHVFINNGKISAQFIILLINVPYAATQFNGTLMPLPKALERDFPNVIDALEENLPLLGSILMGFQALMFVTVATSAEPVVPTGEATAFAKFIPFLGFFPGANIDFPRRDFILSISGTSFVLFFVSLILTVYSRMCRYGHLMSSDDIKRELDATREEFKCKPNLANEVKELARRIENEIRRLDNRRFVNSMLAMLTFVTAVVLTGINGLVFANPITFSVGTEVILLCWLGYLWLLYGSWRQPPRLYKLDPNNPTL